MRVGMQRQQQHHVRVASPDPWNWASARGGKKQKEGREGVGEGGREEKKNEIMEVQTSVNDLLFCCLVNVSELMVRLNDLEQAARVT